MMETNQLLDLLKRYTSGDCTEEEKALVEQSYISWVPGSADLTEQEIAADLLLIAANLPGDKRPVKFSLYKKMAAAAAVLFLVFVGLLYFRSLSRPVLIVKNSPSAEEKILPGTDKAILTLADGRKVVLDKNAATLVSDSLTGLRIRKTANGELVYEVLKKDDLSAGQAIAYNTIATPRGSQYKIILPDGTHVWLNAASSLRYPVVFTGHRRNVELIGEGYFEVAKNKAMPFVVRSGGQKVEVLGTHFNISAYPEEDFIKTTLLEGSVKLKSRGGEALLVPGQQATLLRQHDNFILETVNTDDVVDWKNGIFSFENTDIVSIMKKISRWYDVDVEYRGNLTKMRFGGTVSRFKEVSELLKTMELTGSIHFKIEGRRIIVMP